MLSMLNFYWIYESFEVCIRSLIKNNNVQDYALSLTDLIGYMIHFLYMSLWMYYRGCFYPLLGVWLASCGTAYIVFATHYAEERLEWDENLSLIEQTVRSSRNIKGFFGEDLFWHVISNNLSLQKEHHLFPRMPNVNIRKIQPEIRKILKELNFEYTEDNIVQCHMYSIKQLQMPLVQPEKNHNKKEK